MKTPKLQWVYTYLLTITLFFIPAYGATEHAPKKTSLVRTIITSSHQRPDEEIWKGNFFFKKTTGLTDETITGKATFLDVAANSITIAGSVPKALKLTVNSLSLKGRGAFDSLKADRFSAVGSVTLENSALTHMQISGMLIAKNTQFSSLIIRSHQVYLDDVIANDIFIITDTEKTPRAFVKGDKSQVKNVYFLDSKSLPHVKNFLKGKMTKKEFFESGITRIKGQVIKEAGTVEIIQSTSTPKIFGLSNGITIQLNEEPTDKLAPEINLVHPNGDSVKLPD
jgi:hypothetical protein